MPCESVQASAAKLARLRDECGSPVEPEIAVNIKKVRTTNGSMNSAHLLQLELSTSLFKKSAKKHVIIMLWGSISPQIQSQFQWPITARTFLL